MLAMMIFMVLQLEEVPDFERQDPKNTAGS